MLQLTKLVHVTILAKKLVHLIILISLCNLHVIVAKLDNNLVYETPLFVGQETPSRQGCNK